MNENIYNAVAQSVDEVLKREADNYAELSSINVRVVKNPNTKKKHVITNANFKVKVFSSVEVDDGVKI